MIRFLFLILLLSGCTSLPESQMTQIPHDISDPSDAALFNKIQTYLAQQNGPRNARYDYARIDLNGDGAREGLVLFKLPYTYWCGYGGCTIAVFEARGDGFILRSEIRNIRGPLVVSPIQTRGWSNIIARVSGVNMPDRNVVLSFENGAYPVNAITAPTWNGNLNAALGMRLFP